MQTGGRGDATEGGAGSAGPGAGGEDRPPDWGATGPAAGPTWPHPPAGWYPDPGGDGARWWDGYAWTEHVAAVPSGAQPPGGAAARSAGPGGRWRWEPGAGWQWMPAWAGHGDWPDRMRPMVDAERRIGIFARWALIAFVAAAVGGVAVRVGYTSVVSAYSHWLRLAWDAAKAHAAAPTPPRLPTTYVEVSYLVSLVELAMGTAFLVWQHRAAATARWLGLPGRHTPGWGVAFWFIPVANLWCPYQALRDCLPPGHSARRRVLGCWLLYLAAGLTGAGAYVAAFFSQPAAVALLVVLAVLWLAVLVLGRRLIATVGDAHRAVLGA